jgi:hypothetical protein
MLHKAHIRYDTVVKVLIPALKVGVSAPWRF